MDPEAFSNHPTHDTVPYPVLFNAWKHHAGWLAQRIDRAIADGEAGVARLAAETVVIGARLMDLYVGPLPPEVVADHVLVELRVAGRLDAAAYSAWLAGQSGYAVVTVPADGSRWTLRLGPTDGRYVHLHPGRYSPNTVRVQANPLKTAVLAHALGRLTGRSATDVMVMNEARKRFLGLPPILSIDRAAGLGEVIGLIGGALRPANPACPPAGS